jgi:hypothetical protein
MPPMPFKPAASTVRKREARGRNQFGFQRAVRPQKFDLGSAESPAPRARRNSSATARAGKMCPPVPPATIRMRALGRDYPRTHGQAMLAFQFRSLKQNKSKCKVQNAKSQNRREKSRSFIGFDFCILPFAFCTFAFCLAFQRPAQLDCCEIFNKIPTATRFTSSDDPP